METNNRSSLYLALLLLVVVGVHAPALFHPFFIDDYVYVYQARQFSWHNLERMFCSATMDESASGVWWVPTGTLPFYRPLGQLSFALDYWIWALGPAGYHLTNLALHLGCIVLAWRLASRWFEAPRHALIAAAVFALHPVRGEAVNWISGRFDLLVCASVMASVLAYLKWRETHRFEWAVASLMGYLLGLGCKETAIILPALLVCLDVLPGSYRKRRGGAVPLMATYGIIGVLYLLHRIVLFGSVFGKLPPPYGVDKTSLFAASGSIGWSLAQYLLDVVLCIHVEPVFLLQFWHEHLLIFGVLVALCVAVLAAAAWVGRSRAGLIGLLWLGVFTAPSALSMPGERNIYLASFGFAILLAAAFRSWETGFWMAIPGDGIRSSSRWMKRISYAVVGLWLMVGLANQSIMGRLAWMGEQEYRDLKAELPDPPRDAKLYVVNQSPLNSVGFTQAIQLRYGRSDLSGCALSLSPTIPQSSTDRIDQVGPDEIQISRENGFFLAGFVERFHRFSEPASTLGEAARRSGLMLLNPPDSLNGLRLLTFRLPYPVNDPRIRLFSWNNDRIHDYLDLFRTNQRAELRPCTLSADVDTHSLPPQPIKSVD